MMNNYESPKEIYKNTDFTVENQKEAFNKLVNERKSKFYNIIYDQKIKIEKIERCYYCQRNRELSSKLIYLEFNNSFGEFCSSLCSDLYFNLFDYNFDISKKTVNLPPISFIFEENRHKIYNLIDTLKYDDILSIKTLKETPGIMKIVVDTKNDNQKYFFIRVYETLRKKCNIEDKKCLYCNSGTKDKKKYIKTYNKSYIGPFCSFICKVTYNRTISKIVPVDKIYSFNLPDYNILSSQDYLEKIKDIIKDKKNISSGHIIIYINQGEFYIHIKIYVEPIES